MTVVSIRGACKLDRLVIHHPDLGIYLGGFLGMGFWSKQDAVGQDCAVTFASVIEAEAHMASWDDGRPTKATLQPVHADEGKYASAEACAAAGLEAWPLDNVRV